MPTDPRQEQCLASLQTLEAESTWDPVRWATKPLVWYMSSQGELYQGCMCVIMLFTLSRRFHPDSYFCHEMLESRFEEKETVVLSLTTYGKSSSKYFTSSLIASNRD